jgi:hypothetical protein
VVYFVLALWLFRAPNCGYGRVLSKLVDALYHRRRGQQLLDGVVDPDGWVEGGGRRWRPPNISSLARARARARLGVDPLHMLFDEVAGPVGADGAAGVFCCGLRVVSMEAPPAMNTEENAGRSAPRSTPPASHRIRSVPARPVGHEPDR